MNKRDFIKTSGMIGVASLIPFKKILAGNLDEEGSICTLIPSETAGPFPLDLTTNAFYFRQDVRQNKTGAQLNLKLKIFGIGNCAVMPNLRINIWHCDKDGLYSGYDQPGNVGQAGLTYLRGYQITDSNGEVEFITIFPGWYNGRICHIHFQVYVSTQYAAVSQLTFDIAEKNAVYSAFPNLYTKGPDPTSYSNDNIFSDGYSYQLAPLTPNVNTGGYDAYLEVGIQGTGVGIGHIESENAKQFSLGQNVPNPFTERTEIPFYLRYESDVVLDVYDLAGKKVWSIKQIGLLPGKHEISFEENQLTAIKRGYIYQLEVTNSNGVFRSCKMMTKAR